MKLQEMIETGAATFEEVETAMFNMKERIETQKVKIAELETLHFQDQAEIVRLRRFAQALEEKHE